MRAIFAYYSEVVSFSIGVEKGKNDRKRSYNIISSGYANKRHVELISLVSTAKKQDTRVLIQVFNSPFI